MGKVGSSQIGFFFGAGASIQFGIPSIRQVTEQFAKQMCQNGGQEKKLFFTVYNFFKKLYGQDKVDIEAIMSVITGLGEKHILKENIGDLGLFLSKGRTVDVANALLHKYSPLTIDNLEKYFRTFIRTKFSLYSDGINHIGKVHSDLIEKLRTVLEGIGSHTVNNKDIYVDDDWVLFTTNYDTVLEYFWTKIQGLTLNTGFERHIMDPDGFVFDYNSTSEKSLKLVKLHGSRNWARRSDGCIEELPLSDHFGHATETSQSGTYAEEMVIYPVSQKQLYVTPYIQLFQILNNELGHRKIWLVIGYSFRDIIIRSMFQKSLEDNENHVLILVLPEPNEITKLFSADVRDRILHVVGEFGNRTSYNIVNQNIAVKLSSL